MSTDRQPVLVLDMASLRFQAARTRGTVRVTTRDGQLLGVVYSRAGESRSDVAFRAMDAALREGSVLDVDPTAPARRVTRQVALLNPFTGDIAWRGVPDTVTFFSAGTVVDVDPDGTVADVVTVDSQLELHVGDHALPAGVRGQGQLLAALELHAG